MNSPHEVPVTRKCFRLITSLCEDIVWGQMLERVSVNTALEKCVTIYFTGKSCHLVKRLLMFTSWRWRHMRVDSSQFTGQCAKAYQADNKEGLKALHNANGSPKMFKMCTHVMASSWQSPKLDEKLLTATLLAQRASNAEDTLIRKRHHDYHRKLRWHNLG